MRFGLDSQCRAQHRPEVGIAAEFNRVSVVLGLPDS
jgi:hypothetical protein